MSVKAIDAAIDALDLTPTQRLVLILLANHANAEAECWPSTPYLMRKSGLSERGVRKALSELEGRTLISRSARLSATGKTQSNLVRLTFVKGSDPCTPCTPTPAHGAPLPLHTVHPTPAHGAPSTTLEPSIEPSYEPGRARDRVAAFERLSVAWARVSPGRVSPAKGWPAFAAAAELCAPEKIVAAGERYLAEDADVKRLKTAISLHIWLIERRWEPWLREPAVAPGVGGGWHGPAAIRDAVADRRGSDFAGSWLDPARWDAERRAILTRTGVGAERLREALSGATWAALGVVSIEKGKS